MDVAPSAGVADAALGAAVGLLLPSGAAGGVGVRLGSRGWLWP